MYIQELPSRKTEYGVLTNTGRLAASFDNIDRADEYRQKVDPSWQVIEITQTFTPVKISKRKRKAQPARTLQPRDNEALAIAA